MATEIDPHALEAAEQFRERLEDPAVLVKVYTAIQVAMEDVAPEAVKSYSQEPEFRGDYHHLNDYVALENAMYGGNDTAEEVAMSSGWWKD